MTDECVDDYIGDPDAFLSHSDHIGYEESPGVWMFLPSNQLGTYYKLSLMSATADRWKIESWSGEDYLQDRNIVEEDAGSNPQ